GMQGMQGLSQKDMESIKAIDSGEIARIATSLGEETGVSNATMENDMGDAEVLSDEGLDEIKKNLKEIGIQSGGGKNGATLRSNRIIKGGADLDADLATFRNSVLNNASATQSASNSMAADMTTGTNSKSSMEGGARKNKKKTKSSS